MKLVVKHFPKHRKYYKIFIKNTIKLSYSCMPNIASIIIKHENNFLKENYHAQPTTCNCRDKVSCPINDRWPKECSVWKSRISISNETKYCFVRLVKLKLCTITINSHLYTVMMKNNRPFKLHLDVKRHS